jgi:hypothetical protein
VADQDIFAFETPEAVVLTDVEREECLFGHLKRVSWSAAS